METLTPEQEREFKAHFEGVDEPKEKTPSVSVTMARLIQRQEELTFILLRVVNALDLGLPEMAKEIAQRAIREESKS